MIMEEKSHVSLEQHACLVCGVSFGTGSILLDKCLRATMKRCTGMGWGLCPEHQKLSYDGLVALIECDLQRSGSPSGNGNLTPDQGPSAPFRGAAHFVGCG
jgi:hypothetical protein